MFVIKKDFSLKPYNTFGFDVKARYFAKANTIEKILYSINFSFYNKLPIFVLGGGSNVLLLSDIDGVVINPSIPGIELRGETADRVTLRIGAGIVWDDFVAFAVQRGLGGIENLSGIPGHVGAAPVQNIGAYGVEVKDAILKVEAIDIAQRKPIEFGKDDCRFGYRDSLFKSALKGKVIITHVWFTLSKNPVFTLSYGNLKDYFGTGEVTLSGIRKAILEIRSAKLPDPAELGNAGSFFKNPIIPVEQYTKLKERYPDIPSYTISDKQVKLPAGWLIERAGWKGKRMGNCGVHDKQALVLVNYGNATGKDLLELAQAIGKTVEERFGITLQMEVSPLVP